MKRWLVRHTRADIADGICYGRSDIDLPASFDADAQPLLAALSREPEVAVYSSPLRRCARLAQRIGAPVFDARLQEVDFGAWELKPWAKVDSAALEQWAADPLDWRVPGGETVRELAMRACAVLDEIKSFSVPNACLVTHGGVVRMLCAYLWRQPFERALDMSVPFGSGLNIRWTEDARLLATHGWSEDGTALPGWGSQ